MPGFVSPYSESPPSASPAVAAVVVTWNSAAEIAACLAALAGSTAPPAHILVVDNASTDDTVAAARAACPAAEVLRLGRNHHFAYAANAGLARALALGAAAVLVLNPDATLAPGALAEMRRVLHSAPDIGLVGARLEHPARPGHPARVIVGGICSFVTGDVREPPPPPDAALDQLAVDYVWGCALLARAAVLRQVGVFDARLIAYYEDADLCLRARAAGWRTVTALRARVRHLGATAGDRRRLQQVWLRGCNWLLVFMRHAPPSARPRLLLRLLGWQLPRFAWDALTRAMADV
ncbi:MAG: glycosyltransferase family 2 protein [Anaerolineales bacterium]|nr:glycosyltransferase family 2 protein [Anaerolineales bacterium]